MQQRCLFNITKKIAIKKRKNCLLKVLAALSTIMELYVLLSKFYMELFNQASITR